MQYIKPDVATICTFGNGCPMAKLFYSSAGAKGNELALEHQER